MKKKDKPKTYQVCFESDLLKIKDASTEAIKFISDNNPDINKNDIYDIKLAMNETLANAVLHGNKKDKDKNVYLQLQVNQNAVTVKVADEGQGFDHMNHMAKYNAFRIRDLVSSIFINCGMSKEDADITAEVLVDANLCGRDSHGVLRVETYVNRLKKGGTNPKAHPLLVRETPTAAVLDGNDTMGLVAAYKASEL